jgi:hypothetical protein
VIRSKSARNQEAIRKIKEEAPLKAEKAPAFRKG